MATDLTIALVNRPGSLAAASEALGRAGINIDGACGYVCGEIGNYHVLVAEPERARHALIDAGFEIIDERLVAVCAVDDRPGAAAALLRRVADRGSNVDLLYLTGGKLVVGGDDVAAIERALA
ncbi:MAG: amino acid-binding protein [Chloroflexi bacterium]|nr:amino acid-binding protein [Chloroflexota bacterium]